MKCLGRRAYMIELRTLGTLDLRIRAGSELSSILSQPKRTGLLCYLALARPRGFHRRDKLIAIFWPEADTEHARASLRQAVRFLRRTLGESIVQSRGDEELGLGEGVLECDAAAFDAALAAHEPERALALYGGDLLPGFYVEGAPEFERWLEAERSRLRERAVAGAWALAEAGLRAGDAGAGAEWGRRALAIAPSDEAGLRRLMQHLESLGDGEGAVEAFEAGARRLRLEFEVEPSPATLALAKDIGDRVRRAADPAPAAPAVRWGGARAGEEAPEATPSQAEPPPGDAFPRAAAGVSPRLRRRRWAAVVAGAAIVAGSVGAWLLVRRHAEATALQRVVVAPFENRTGDPALAPLGDMAADWIAQGLSRSGVAEVADGSVARAFSRQAATRPGQPTEGLVRRLSRETGAAFVVTGRCYRQADSVALMAQVVDARSGRVVSAVGPFTSPGTDPMKSLDELRQRTVGALAVLLDDRVGLRPAEYRTPTYEAYSEYMEGVYRAEALNEYGEAAENYLRAYQLDTTFYRALVSASFASLMHGPRARYDSLQPVLRRIYDRLTPSERLGLDWQRAYREWDCQAMYALLRQGARRVPPTENGVFGLAVTAGRVHRYRESIALMRRVHPDRPLTPRWYWTFLGAAHHALDDFRGQMKAADEMARRSPGSVAPDVMRMVAHAALGHTAEVRTLASALAARAAQDTMFYQEVRNIESLGMPPRTPAITFFLAARELRAHGHDPQARLLVGDGLRWSRARPLSEQADTTFRWLYAQLLAMSGRWQEADALLPAAPPPGWDPPLQWSRALMAAHAGDSARALAISRGFAATPRPMLEFQRVSTLAALGRQEETRTRLREMLAAGGFFGEWWLHTEPALAPYLAEPEMRRLLRVDG